jgi:hypothetical protein
LHQGSHCCSLGVGLLWLSNESGVLLHTASALGPWYFLGVVKDAS